jgi:hypothetical protein
MQVIADPGFPDTPGTPRLDPDEPLRGVARDSKSHRACSFYESLFH